MKTALARSRAALNMFVPGDPGTQKAWLAPERHAPRCWRSWRTPTGRRRAPADWRWPWWPQWSPENQATIAGRPAREVAALGPDPQRCPQPAFVVDGALDDANAPAVTWDEEHDQRRIFGCAMVVARAPETRRGEGRG